MKFTGKLAALLAAPLLAVSGAASASHIFISDLGANVDWIYDGDADDTLGATAGAVGVVKQGFGAWSFAIAAGDGLPNSGTTDKPDVHLTVSASSQSAANLFVVFYDYGDPNGSGSGQYNAGIFNWLASAGGALDPHSVMSWGTCANDAAFAGCNWQTNGTPIDQTGLLFQMAGFGSQTGSASFAAPWSTAIFFFLSHTDRRGGNSSVDMDLAAVPEPGSLALLGLGLLGLGAARRKRA